jgi:hypothetical protein
MASLIALAGFAALLGVLLWLGDRRGWLNLRRSEGASGGNPFIQIQKLLEPSSAYVERHQQERSLKREDRAAE